MGFTTIYDYAFKGKDVSIFDVEHGFTMYIKHPCGEVIEIFEGIDGIEGAKLIGEAFIDSLPVAHEPHCDDDYCIEVFNNQKETKMKERIERLEQELAELKAELNKEETREWVYWVYWVFDCDNLNNPRLVKITLPKPIKVDSVGDVHLGSIHPELRYNYYRECYISDTLEGLKEKMKNLIDACEVVE